MVMSTTTTDCPFCAIAKTYPPSEAWVPRDPDPELITPNCHLILSTDLVLAFCDILPMTKGHVLLVSREHREKLGDLKGSEGAALGSWLPVLSRAVMKALGKGDGDWNIVQNNGVTAAQIVPHVHYHIIPRGGDVPEIKARSWTMFGRGQRSELDDDEGIELSRLIRDELTKEFKEMEEMDPKGKLILGKL